MTRRTGALLAAFALALTACGVGYDAPEGVELPAPVTAPTVPTAQTEPCENSGPDAPVPAVASYAPTPLPTPGSMPPGTYMAEIAERGRLIVGTSIDTQLFASVDPESGAIQGFDVDIANLVAAAIFGGTWDDPDVDPLVELRGITYAQRIPEVAAGNVDLVAHTMTINCTRWQQVAFSSVYLNAGQSLLVPSDSPVTLGGYDPPETALEQLAGQTVCVSAGGTSADVMRELEVQPPIDVIEVSNQTDCLVAFQRGEADAIRSDNTVLAGFASQDPYTKVLEGQFLTEEPYGLAMSLEHPELTQFVNAVLEQARVNGDWARIYDKWLRAELPEPLATLDPATPGVPQADHSRPLPT